MRDVLDDDLAELYVVRGYDDVRLARLREQLFADRPKPRRWTGVVAVAAAVVLIAGLVVTLRPAPRDWAASLPPVTSLAEAADRLEATAQPQGRYRHVKYTIWQTVVVDNAGGFDAAALEYAIDAWVPVEKGQPVTIDRRFTGNQRGVLGVPQSPLGVNPGHAHQGPPLWGTWCTTTPCREGSLALPLSVNPVQKLDDVSSRLFSPFTTNEEKAATYRELAASPEIHWDGGTLSVDGGLTTFQIDPATGQPVGSVQERPADSPLPGGTPVQTVTVTWEWTDQRPS